MFDIAGFWMAATVFCLPPIILSLLVLLEITRAMVRKESNYELDLEVYHKVRRFFGCDIGIPVFISMIFSIPMLILVATYFTSWQIEQAGITFIQWLSHCCEVWAIFGSWVVMTATIFVVVKVSVKGYVKLTLLAERVKKL